MDILFEAVVTFLTALLTILSDLAVWAGSHPYSVLGITAGILVFWRIGKYADAQTAKDPLEAILDFFIGWGWRGIAYLVLIVLIVLIPSCGAWTVNFAFNRLEKAGEIKIDANPNDGASSSALPTAAPALQQGGGDPLSGDPNAGGGGPPNAGSGVIPTPQVITCNRPVHVVGAGDTLNKIASWCQVTLGQLMQWNPGITNPNVITPGQQIRTGP